MKSCMRSTSELRPGDRIQLIDFGATPLAYRKRLLALGLRPGVHVQFVQTAPLGCPMYFKTQNLRLILRQEEAQALVWGEL
jgi:ferrous iron transport protein A